MIRALLLLEIVLVAIIVVDRLAVQPGNVPVSTVASAIVLPLASSREHARREATRSGATIVPAALERVDLVMNAPRKPQPYAAQPPACEVAALVAIGGCAFPGP